MKIILIIFALLPLHLKGQVNIIESCICSEKTLAKPSPDGKIYVEDMAKYPGDIEAFNKFLRETIKYDSAVNAKIILTFIINCEGNTCSFQVKSKENDLPVDQTNNIIDNLKVMDKWQPAKRRGKPIDLPMKINLEIEKGRIKS